MSIRYCNSYSNIGSVNNATLICVKQWILHSLTNYQNNDRIEELSEDCILFKSYQINTPFLMDGNALKIAEQLKLHKNCEINKVYQELHHSRKRRKKVTTSSLSPYEQNQLTDILNAHKCMVKDSSFKKLFDVFPTFKNYEQNNLDARQSSEKILSKNDIVGNNLHGKNDSDCAIVSRIASQDFLIPPRSCYIKSTVFDLDKYISGQTFEYIVMDPPWFNKHIRRRKKARGLNHSYETLKVQELMEIPLSSFLSSDGLVLVWITNSSTIYENFATSLHLWNLEIVTVWYWLKLTTSGELAIPSEVTLSKGKLPYEKLLICRRINSKRKVITNLLVGSIPSCVHSHKPPLNEVMEKYLGLRPGEKCLELFARNLVPGWTSIGLEVLKLQHLSFYVNQS